MLTLNEFKEVYKNEILEKEENVPSYLNGYRHFYQKYLHAFEFNPDSFLEFGVRYSYTLKCFELALGRKIKYQGYDLEKKSSLPTTLCDLNHLDNFNFVSNYDFVHIDIPEESLARTLFSRCILKSPKVVCMNLFTDFNFYVIKTNVVRETLWIRE